MKPIAMAFALLVFAAASAAEPKPTVVYQWEYRVLTEEQVIALGKNGLAAGLNQLGDEGWELVTVGAHYIFKRPKDLAKKQAAEIKTRISIAEADVEAWKDRLNWAERMLRKGYMTEKHLESERAQLKKAEADLAAAREALKKLLPAADQPEQKGPKSEK